MYIPKSTEYIVKGNKKLYSAVATSEQLGMSYQYLRRLAQWGRVPATKEAGRWWFNIPELLKHVRV